MEITYKPTYMKTNLHFYTRQISMRPPDTAEMAKQRLPINNRNCSCVAYPFNGE